MNAGGDDPGMPQLGKSRAERMAAAVLPASGVVWTAAEAMHLAGVHAVTPAAVATVLGSAVAWGAAGRGKAPSSLPWWIGISGSWFTLAEALGPLHWWPAPVLTIIGVGIALRAAWAARRHKAVIAAQEWREQRANWLMIRNNWHLGGSHLTEFKTTPLGELYTIDIRGTRRKRSQILASGLEEVIAMAENLAENRVQVRKHWLATRIIISIRRADPWAKPLLHPLTGENPEITLPAVRSILNEAPVGQDPETGELLTVPLYDETGGKNVSVTGIKGAGKGVMLDDLSEHVTAAPDALMVRLNISVKGYAEAESWGPACHLTAFGPDQKSRAAAVLKVIGGIIEHRARTCKRGQYVPSPKDPAIVVFVDESDSAAEVPAVKAGLNMIATKGREYGVSYVHAGQRGTADYSSSKARSQDDVYCTGLVKNANESRHAGGRGGPDMSAYGEGKPGVWKVERLGGGVSAGRTWVFSPSAARHGAEVERIAQERAFSQPQLPAACRAYLGDAYETLLSTEVFTRWAHASGVHDTEDGDDSAPASPPPAAPHGEPAAATAAKVPAAAPKTALADEDPFETWLEMDVDEDTQTRIDGIHEKLAGARQMIAETAAMPRPEAEVDPAARAAYTAERWRQVGEEAQIPESARPRLLEMLGEGTTISAIAKEFGVSRWTARTWLEKFRGEKLAYVDGERKGARWRLATPPEDGDAQ